MVRLGVVVLPEHRWQRTRRTWTDLEALGVHHGWTFDHFAWRSLSDEPWYDAVATLSAVAAVTDRIGLGTLVTTPNFRHPVPLAKQVMTLDEISAGRFVLGVGAGAAGQDTTLLGGQELDPRRRADRFEEFVDVLDLVLRQRITDHDGEHFTARRARMNPGCVQSPRVPFAVAGAGPRGMHLAARYARCWVTIGDPADPGGGHEQAAWQVLAGQLARLADACAETGRDPATLDKLVNLSRVVPDPYGSVDRFTDAVGRCAELGFTDVVVNHPRPAGVFHGDQDAFTAAVQAVLA